MKRDFAPRIATGNDLLEGDVVYFTAQGGWSRAHADAALARTPQEAEALLARASRFPLQVVGVYLAEARAESDGPAPAHFREDFRARGPSNRFHGKQADGDAPGRE